MKNKKNEFVILITVSAIFAFVWLPKLKLIKKAAGPLTSESISTQIPGDSGSLPAEKAPPAELLSNIKYISNSRDPLDNSAVIAQQETGTQQQEPGTPLPQLSISAVVWGSAKPQAVINSKVICIGETIEGVKVLNIGKEGIKIDFNGKEILLPTK